VLSMSDRYHWLVNYLMKVICADRYVVLIKKVVLHTDIVVNTLFQQVQLFDSGFINKMISTNDMYFDPIVEIWVYSTQNYKVKVFFVSFLRLFGRKDWKRGDPYWKYTVFNHSLLCSNEYSLS
jgi:hypothetical protein